MEYQIATNKAQSERLIKCGISSDTSDMHIQEIKTGSNPDDNFIELFPRSFGLAGLGSSISKETPSWSLNAIMKVLTDDVIATLKLHVDTHFSAKNCEWCVICASNDFLFDTKDKSLIETTVQMIEKLSNYRYGHKTVFI